MKTLDWNEYLKKSAETVSEGIVMLKNDNSSHGEPTLPIDPNKEIAVFGRIQLNYYKSGTGSGGLVNVSRVVGITDGLMEAGVNINTELLRVYKDWQEENPFDNGGGWSGEPWCQKEMPVDSALAEKIARTSDTALVIIGRTAGEENDNSDEKGSFALSEGEEEMLKTVREHFKKVAVLLNTGNIMNMDFVEKYSPDAVLYVWQGGMVGGVGTADVLTGRVSPSGKLPDTVAKSVSDYPAAKYFGDETRSFYNEDIYVGYRYFETFAPEKVLYPFGFGLSYTTFEIKTDSAEFTGDKAVIKISVTNTGNCSGKEVVQLYSRAPQGALGKPAVTLCAFEKTKLLSPGETEIIPFEIDLYAISSFDDSGVTGHKSCFVLEAGDYEISAGNCCRSLSPALAFNIPETRVTKQCTHALAPVMGFERIKPVPEKVGYKISMENVPLMEEYEDVRRQKNLPETIPQTGDRGIKLADVKNGRADMSEFIAQLSDNDLACIIRGEGMSSPKVTPGTAAAFGGVSESLRNMGIPCGCCSDGPSGMRLDCGTKAFSLPNGTLIASTFNKQLMTELFYLTGLEMSANKVDCLLGPGMNIHRHPLNGRNFEYFSEDPLLTGEMAAAELQGLHSAGVTGTVKHFCGNNKETGRHTIDSVISERALREIYLKGFETAVKKGGAYTVMTTYGSVNGLWTAASYDLTSTILRDEWGFEGLVMTDWWADINRRDTPRGQQNHTDFAAMAAAQNDVYMVCADGADNDDNTLAELEKGFISRGELQRNAANICAVLMRTHAMDRAEGKEEKVEVINRPKDADGSDDREVKCYDCKGGLIISPDDICTDKGKDYIFIADVSPTGYYKVTVTASSTAGELAQLPVTLFSMGSPCAAFTWRGTGGKPISMESGKIFFFSRFTTLRLYFAQSGLTIHSIELKKVEE